MIEDWKGIAERLKAVLGGWMANVAGANLVLYALGYLSLRFHLYAMGVPATLDAIDERYLYGGAQFLVNLVLLIPSALIVLIPIGAPVAGVVWLTRRFAPQSTEEAGERKRWPARRLFFVCGLVSLVAVQGLRQCFFLQDLLLSDRMPAAAWVNRVALDPDLTSLFMACHVGLVMLCTALFFTARSRSTGDRQEGATEAGAALFLGILTLLLPVTYGILAIHKTVPRVAFTGAERVKECSSAWLIWPSKDWSTYLVRDGSGRRTLLSVKEADVTRREILAMDPVLRKLFVESLPACGPERKP